MLRYTITPKQVARTRRPRDPSVVDLRLTVTNDADRDVACDRLDFTAQPGDGPDNLTDEEHVGAIAPAAAPGTPWYILSDDVGGFTAIPRLPGFRLAPDQSIAFVLRGVVVNAVEGTATITIGGAGGGRVSVVKNDGRPVISDFRGTPAEIELGGASELSWTASGASSYTLKTGTETIPFDRYETGYRVTPTTTTTYTLTADGDGPPAVAQFTVAVRPLRIHEFRAQPAELTQGDQVTLHWVVSSARTVVIDPGHHEVNREAGSLPLPLSASQRFQLTASREGQPPEQRSVDVTVMPVNIRELVADPPVIAPGGSALLRWDTTWANGFQLTPPGADLDRWADQYEVRPAATTTYGLTARGLQPQRREVTVAVGAAITQLGFTADPAQPGGIRLRWEVLCGKAHLGTGPGSQPPLAPVPAVGDQWVPLSARPTYIRLVASGDGPVGGGEALLILGGFAVVGALRLSSFEVSAASGVTSPRTESTVDWASAGGVVSGSVRDGDGRQQLGGESGRRRVRIGSRVAYQPLWEGDLAVENRATGEYIGLSWEIV
jgi:hypothetical protein